MAYLGHLLVFCLGDAVGVDSPGTLICDEETLAFNVVDSEQSKYYRRCQ